MLLPILLALHSPAATISVDPATLLVTLTPADGKTGLPLSGAQAGLGVVANLSSAETTASWTYADKHVAVSFQLDGRTLIARFTADAESSFTFPAIPSDPAYSSYLLPIFEGFDIPADDADWIKHLSQDPLDTTADLSMPFWGIQTPTHTLTFLLPNPFGNELAFHEDHGRLALAFTHRFRRNWPVKEYSVRITLSDPSPIEPALIYRQYLKETHQFVSLKDKIARTPDAAKLLGAPHVYLWGGDAITAGDIKDFKSFAAEIVRQSRSAGDSPGKQLFSLFSPEIQKLLVTLPGVEYVDNYIKSQITGDLSRILLRPDFPPVLLAKTFPTFLNPLESWGDGVSAKMIHVLKKAGLDRLRIVVSDAADLRHNPGAVTAARDAGYLIGPYDSYNSVHPKNLANTWETAQFPDADLYTTGAILKPDGTPYKGFQQKGHLLSPLVALPFVKERVAAWMKEFPANLWFMDCDAFGQLYDDFSPVHPATQLDDMNARLARLAWIRDTYHCVIGSEGGSSYAAGVLHFAEGPETPALGWGDPDLQKDKSSPYYLGGYYPPNAPAIFFKSVPLKPSYYKFYFDPRYRVPLYQAALHDSLIATHHWSFSSFKLEDQIRTRELLELLYEVPPLYHLNLAEFAKYKDAILAHYAFFSPLHRQTALLPMTDFSYLTRIQNDSRAGKTRPASGAAKRGERESNGIRIIPDHLIQRTTFGGTIEIVANFSDRVFTYRDHDIAPGAVAALHGDSGTFKLYEPSASLNHP